MFAVKLAGDGTIKINNGTGAMPTFCSLNLFFGIEGQSNAAGYGAGCGFSTTGGVDLRPNNSLVTPLTDPNGDNTYSPFTGGTGSAWPSMAQRLYQLTGRKTIIINLGIPSAGLTVSGGGNMWGPGADCRYPQFSNRITNALSVLAGSAYSNFEYHGDIWWQGETDGGMGVSTNTYRDALITFINQVHGDWPRYLRNFYMVKIKSTLSGYPNIRAADDLVEAAHNRAFVAAENLAPYYDPANAHHIQSEYNAIGIDIAEFIAEN